jgi:hypothetical protein
MQSILHEPVNDVARQGESLTDFANLVFSIFEILPTEAQAP